MLLLCLEAVIIPSASQNTAYCGI